MKSLPFDHSARRGLARRLIAGAAFVAGVATPPLAVGALTDIASFPPSSAASTTVPPNVLFILDASGSMNREYMPEEMQNETANVAHASHRCNTVYYNPTVTYLVPKNADGTDFPAPAFTAADNDGFMSTGNTGVPSSLPANGTTDLSSGYRGTTTSGSERAFYYRWTNGASNPTSSDCTNSPTASRSFPHTPSASWTKVRIPDPADLTRTAAQQEQNFANWFTYYRTRMLLMKSAGGRAFVGLPDTFRVGFITICPDGSGCGNDTAVVPVTAPHYLQIDGFAPAHKSAWYAKFYSQTPSGSTPLKQALSRAGRHYAGFQDGINAGMTGDPVQYSCQQNFTILTTDGYWNNGRGKTLTGGTSGTADIGAQDSNSGLTLRPMFDGGPVNQVVVTTNNQEQYRSRSGGQPSCTTSSLRKFYEARVQTVTVTTPQFGSPSTSTSTGSVTTVNVCSTNTTTWTTISSTTSSSYADTGGIANTLADVAEYYYRTDLRPAAPAARSIGALGNDVGTNNNVPTSGTGVEDDKATHQHMTTFTLGLGLDGNLTFDPNYKSQTVGDFADIRAGRKGWPDPFPSTPSDTSVTLQQRMARIDDLWHAAVNGRGQYFSAKDPTTLALSLQTALLSVQTRLASAAAAATSTLEPTTGDNLIIVPTYTTSEWSGEMKAFQIDLVTGSPTYGQVLPAVIWSAQAKLDAKTKTACDGRTIKLFRAGATDNVVDFTWNTQACDATGTPIGSPTTALNAAEQAFFTSAGTTDEPSLLGHWGLMTDGSGGTINQKADASGANLVNFLRGHRGREIFAPNTNRLYRERKHVLGDIVNSQPVYVRRALFSYADSGYAAFATSVASRAPMVYAAANDGMLHAFTGASDSTGGEELWAYIPRAVLPQLYKLADNGYPNLHQYYVDGRPVVADVFDSTTSTWKTILVGGLNKGGQSYYALDVTDPATPKALWEFTHSPSTCSGAGQFSDCHLGLTFGNPVVSKLADGRWVVFVTSGYNNVNTPAQTGDGQGYLYVLEAMTGKILFKIGTGVGDATTPSGLSKITAWVNNADQNNTTLRVYGVDLLGNVWRFDVNDDPLLVPAGREATLLATLKDPSGNPQPITIPPRLSEVGSPPSPFVYVGTGRYLATSDVGNTQVQSVYAIKDPLTSTPYADLRSSLKQITLTSVGNDRFVNCNTASPTANCTSADGWMVDLPEPGERVNVPMELQLGSLAVASNVPAVTACEPGGFSFFMVFDFATGFSPAGTLQPVGLRLSGLTVGISLVRLPDGSVVVYRQRGDPPPEGTPEKLDADVASGAPTGKRTTWREILP